jgi:uncharacterized SAM-binding protein YcdF (DUF218 family)
MFIIGKILAALVFPPGLYIVLALAALVFYAFKKRKTAISIIVLDIILSYTLSITAFSSLIMLPLENKFPPIQNAQESIAIVVLGGGYNDISPEYGGKPALAPESEKRAVYGLELSRRYNLPLIYSGGTGFDVKTKGSEAEAAGILWQNLGVPATKMTLENQSIDTKTNASKVAALYKGKRVILVTSAYHMPRAMLSFEKAGFHPAAAPTAYFAKRSPYTWADYLPSVWALENSMKALHEYVGILWYRLTL